MAEVVLLVAAEAEALASYALYEERRGGRGEIFSADLEHILELLREFPRLAPIFAAAFHRLKCPAIPTRYSTMSSEIA